MSVHVMCHRCVLGVVLGCVCVGRIRVGWRVRCGGPCVSSASSDIGTGISLYDRACLLQESRNGETIGEELEQKNDEGRQSETSASNQSIKQNRRTSVSTCGRVCRCDVFALLCLFVRCKLTICATFGRFSFCVCCANLCRII